MAQEHTSHREVLSAIGRVESLAELITTHTGDFNAELDLEVAVYGRRYRGGRVGPYIRLFTYQPGEAIVQEGDWGGNTFYLVIDGVVETFVRSEHGETKVAESSAGSLVGEMSVLAGVPRNATVRANKSTAVQVLEIQRPALRLLRKLPVFADALNDTYISHGKNSILEALALTSHFSEQTLRFLRASSSFRVLSEGDFLMVEDTPVDQLTIVREGWIRRETSAGKSDFLGKGFCLGVDLMEDGGRWTYSSKATGRTEILEIPLTFVRLDRAIYGKLINDLAPLKPPAIAETRPESQPTLEKLIETDLADGTNLLIMDMDLCVRCGNCSLACHRIHGQSRLLRKGIGLRRTKPDTLKPQSLLFPSACLHCKDPACMTGCPTGAIGRQPTGNIDINPQICIGCGDCATQCPYHAVSMVPRSGEAREHHAPGLFQIRLDALPLPVEETEDMVAVKCNLCEATPLNPAGAKRAAFGCEESCPTGALVRINPHLYFKEISQIESLLFLDSTHAVGRNIHQSDPAKQRIHTIGTLILLAGAAALVQGLIRYGLDSPVLGFLTLRWITGISGFLLLASIMTYPIRRRIYRKRAGALRYWMILHTYLGAIAAIVIFAHAGRTSGGLLTTALMLCFDMTLITGLFGLLCYRFLPRVMSRLEPEPLLLDDLIRRRVELQGEIKRGLGWAEEPLRKLLTERVFPRLLSLRSIFRQLVKGESVNDMKNRLHETFAKGLNDSERSIFESVITPGVLLSRTDALIHMQRILKLWILPHVIFTSLTISLLLVHIIQVLYFARF